MSNTMIERERNSRPDWVPVPFIPALSFEKIFFDKLRVALAFAVQHFGVRFRCYIEMGLLGTMNVSLAIDRDDMRAIRSKEIITQLTLPNPSDAALTRHYWHSSIKCTMPRDTRDPQCSLIFLWVHRRQHNLHRIRGIP